ncbi:MAG: hypothetical protein HY929_04920 [Euryarchaeota archaeon]|nr:hypothetical protein [Euryarchaeota archaeon]
MSIKEEFDIEEEFRKIDELTGKKWDKPLFYLSLALFIAAIILLIFEIIRLLRGENLAVY